MRRVWLALVCAALQLVSVSTGPSQAPSTLAFVVFVAAGLGAAAALPVRHRAPLLVLAAATLGEVVQVLVAGPVLPVVVTVAAFTVARELLLGPRSPVRPAGALLAAVLAVSGVLSLTGQVGLAAPYALLVLLGVLAGLTIAVRAARAAAVRRELVHAERLRIARDLHDAVGHAVGAIAVQAGASRMAVAAGATDEATLALAAIEEAARTMLRDVRWMVGLLREDAERPSLSRLPGLVGAARRSGLDITVHEEGNLSGVPDETGEAAYRIVQEAITNVLRHSRASAAVVRIAVGSHVEVAVHDNGAGGGDHGEGNGLRGMQERAAAVGGSVQAGPAPAGGWAVTTRLPARVR